MKLSSVTVGHLLNHLNNSDRRNHRDHEENTRQLHERALLKMKLRVYGLEGGIS